MSAAKKQTRPYPEPTTSGSFDVNADVTIAYDVFGELTPSSDVLILVHETGGTKEVFSRLIPVLSPYYTVIAYDLRGHGASTGDDSQTTYQDHARDLFTLMNRLQIGQACLVGASDGGAIVLQFAATHQERVAALVVISTPLDISALTTQARLSSSIDKRIGGLLTGMSRHLGDDYFGPSTLIGTSEVELAPLSRINVDALVITADNDPIKREHSKQIADALVNGELRFVDTNARDLLVEAPDELNEMIRHWLVDEG